MRPFCFCVFGVAPALSEFEPAVVCALLHSVFTGHSLTNSKHPTAQVLGNVASFTLLVIIFTTFSNTFCQDICRRDDPVLNPFLSSPFEGLSLERRLAADLEGTATAS